MKRFYVCLAALTLLFVLCGCQERGNPNVYDVDYNGKTCTVDREGGTITCDGVVYSFTISTRGINTVDFEVTYPDGSRYYWTRDEYSSYGGWSDDYNPKARGYVPGEILREAAIKEDVPPVNFAGVFLAILLAALGAVLVWKPRIMWTLSHGWRFKDAEPSDLALMVNRIVGVLVLAVAFYIFVESMIANVG